MTTEIDVIRIPGGSIEVHPAEFRIMTRQDDGSTTVGDPLHKSANVRVFLGTEDGFFAFDLEPQQARELTAAVERACPDA